MKAVRLCASLLHVFVVIPIWLFLLHTILAASHVDRLVWFLFWVYMPMNFFIALLMAIGQEGKKA